MVELVKENIRARAPIPAWGVWAAAGGTLAALALVSLVDLALPEPRGRHNAPPTAFMADLAYEHLVNLTSIGPRVAGTYENEVAAVSMLVEAIRGIAREASPHNYVEVDLHRSSGAFSLTFFDGMNNVYRDVQSVVGRVRGAGGAAAPALLLNCHYDTVADSPGASDDGAGCAVLLEVMRALAASPSPLRHPVVFLFNGAEENIMQASHAFITTHKWAASVRAFINLEACGAGGREVLFQAGPHDPWIVEVYAGAVPHPFASSLAQELFQSGLIPADTDFRIFRDFGKLSGVDLAWSANGYVYHTRLDTAARVPRPALQRTGDNVLALTHGLLSSERLESAVEPWSRQPVFFDVLGQFVVSARAPAALLAALAALALVALHLHLDAEDARKHLYVSRGWWWRQVLRRTARAGAGATLGAGAAAAVGAGLHAARASLSFYARPWLLAPLYAAPALAVNIYVITGGGRKSAGAVWERGWWGARAALDAGCAAWALALAGMLAARLRSGFLPALWAALPAAAARLHRLHPPAPGWWVVTCWCLGGVVPLLQTCYLALGALAMFVPITGRAGSQPVPPDVVLALVVAALALAASSWAAPLLVAARAVHYLILFLVGLCLCTCAFVIAEGGAGAYSAARPQRLMLFHVRRTLHPRPAPAAAAPVVDDHYWVPALDPNTPHSLDHIVPEMKLATPTPPWECSEYVYCGAAYFLPVLGLVPRGARLPAASPPHAAAALHVAHRTHWLEDDLMQLDLNITGPSHVVLVMSPAAGGHVPWCSALQGGLQEARAWGARRTYFLSLHAARAHRRRWQLQVHVRLPEGWKKDNEDKEAVQLSIGGHGMGGPRAPEHQRLLDSLPPTVAGTGWPVHLHIYSL